MRRLEVGAPNYIFTKDIEPRVVAMSFQVQVRREQHNFLSAEFYVEGEEFQTFWDGDRDLDKFSQEKVSWILELDKTPVDAHMLEGIQREVKAASESAEATKQAAIEAAQEKAQGIRDDMQKSIDAVVEEAKTKAQEAVGEQVTQLGAEIEKATAAVAQIATLKSAVRKLLPITDMAQEDIAELVALYEPWEVGESLKVGDIRSYDGKLWEVIQPHTTQDDWKPPTVPALFKEVAPAQTEEGEEIVPEWKQPTGGHDAYSIGDKVLFNGKVYESVIDGNSWSPTDYPQGWKVIE